jgi:hypothetical protein
MASRVTIAGFMTLLALGSGSLAHAQDQAPEPAVAETPTPATPALDGNPPMFGGALRMRWVTIPSWFLGMFTKANQPLSSYGFGGEFFRRKIDRDDPLRAWEVSVGLGYQKMGPKDGNWLGSGKDASQDTDWVQFRNFGLIAFDVSLIARQYFNDVFGIHYGAGLGLGIVTGQILRTSSDNCTEKNLGDSTACKPNICKEDAANCEAQLAASEKYRYPDSVGQPSRFAESSVPGAIPVLNLVLGMDFKVPSVPGLEFRLEGGFYDAFFLGGTVGYIFK